MKDQDLPLDDTLQLDDMPVDFSDTSPIVDGEMYEDSTTSVPRHVVVDGSETEGEIPRKTAYFTVAVLLIINLLNYMDRYTIAGAHLF